MSLEMLTSRSNPLIKQTRALRQHKTRQESGLFLVEGIHHVGEAIEAGWGVETLIYAPDNLNSDFALALLDKQAQRGVRCQPVSADVFDSLAEKENPQGLLAIVRQRSWTFEMLPSNFRLATALVSPQDPGNLGTILRTVDSVGADGVFMLDGGVDPYHPTCIRASMGSIFWKPLIQASFMEFTDWAQTGGVRLIGTSAKATADYRNIKIDNQPTVLVLGSEQKGLLPEQAAACEAMVSLPMRGHVSSLNLAVVAGILLYAFGA